MPYAERVRWTNRCERRVGIARPVRNLAGDPAKISPLSTSPAFIQSPNTTTR
jgi:hypothetical protein